MYLLILPWLVFPASLLGLAYAASNETVQSRVVYQFSNDTWNENIAVRPNGNLLVSQVNTSDLWEINPDPTVIAVPRLVHHFDGFDSTLGLAEISPDVFAVVVNSLYGEPRQNTVWQVNFNTTLPTVQQLANVTGAGTLNGMASLPGTPTNLLASDSTNGSVWKIDTVTGESSIVLRDETMIPNEEVDDTLIGINGLKIVGNYTYYVNTPLRLLCRVQIDINTGEARGPYEVISRGAIADDLAVDANGVAYLAGLIDNVVTKVYPNGTQVVIADESSSPEVAEASSATIGRRPEDSKTVYVATGFGNVVALEGAID